MGGSCNQSLTVIQGFHNHKIWCLSVSTFKATYVEWGSRLTISLLSSHWTLDCLNTVLPLWTAPPLQHVRVWVQSTLQELLAMALRPAQTFSCTICFARQRLHLVSKPVSAQLYPSASLAKTHVEVFSHCPIWNSISISHTSYCILCQFFPHNILSLSNIPLNLLTRLLCFFSLKQLPWKQVFVLVFSSYIYLYCKCVCLCTYSLGMELRGQLGEVSSLTDLSDQTESPDSVSSALTCWVISLAQGLSFCQWFTPKNVNNAQHCSR